MTTVKLKNFISSTLEISLANIPRIYTYLCSTLEISLANILRDVLVLLDVADVHQCNKVDFPYLLFLYDFFMTSFHSSSNVAFSSGINIAWNERSAVCASRFPEACVSERQISRVFWTIRNSLFPKFAEQNNIRSSYFFLPRFTLESISYSPDFLGLLEEFCLTDTLCRETRRHVLAFTLWRELGEELSWDLFIGTNSCVKLY